MCGTQPIVLEVTLEFEEFCAHEFVSVHFSSADMPSVSIFLCYPEIMLEPNHMLICARLQIHMCVMLQ